MNFRRLSDLPSLSSSLLQSGTGAESNAGHHNMLLLIQLRWIAVVGQITTIAVVIFGYGIALPLADLLKVLACLVLFNIASHLRWCASRVVTNRELFLALLVDAAVLTGLLYLTGGTTNPFAFLYLLQVILGAVLLEAWSTWVFVAITSICLACLSLYAKPLILTAGPSNGLSSLYIQGMLLCFALNASLLVFFVSRINNNLRSGAAQLADLRQHAAEEAHIVRMGMLASGAAHELGTPLATLSVILGDWRRMPEFRDNVALLDELGEMQTQLTRCKTIVSGVLMSAGEARSESSTKTTICTFLDEVVLEWRTTRPAVILDYTNHIEQDMPVVFDPALKQMICNVLDNACDASPVWVGFEAMREEGVLRLVVTDAGDGFPAPMLTHFGKPYQSTKGRPGGGLGLFFTVNVVRKLGGVVHARNLAKGGALVQVTLPLAAISLE
ncbi:Sensor histidine kinase PrrB (RegB) [Oxalobacteraceae bacterium IMCC9480]|nr:Sensor histidine kinase PrrB (RegB) [Oxalobacteraceae bacterium IMCC9480]NDP60028.1 HAMP domain-containing histidine kinase [Oxalobacteraceae bacterium]